MLRNIAKKTVAFSVRSISTTNVNNHKVTVIGGAGGIGQPLSLLLKLNPKVTQLAVYDVAKVTPGVAADISHMDHSGGVEGYVGPDEIKSALKGASVVVIPAGVPRKPGMTRDDLFNTNASIAAETIQAIAKHCPKALIAIITNPVNSLVPMAAEILKKAGCYDPKRLFGVTTLDVVRSRSFLGSILNCDPQSVKIPVIGGHAGITILPVLSQCQPKYNGSQSEVEALTARIQDAGTEVVKAKAGGGSATISMGYAGALFADALLRGLDGEKNVVECSYVESNVTDSSFFATPILLGPNGLQENLGLPPLNTYEKKLVDAAIPELKKNIQKGVDFANKK